MISLGSNINAQMASRKLGRNVEEGQKVSERLASGQRINRASDDAAGLAIASSLDANARIYGQGLRNVNDALSLLSIAESAGSELVNILVRIKELAEESANGTYSSAQRNALNSEGQALSAEFNRIISTTKFNNLPLLDGSVSNVEIQAGGNSPAANRLSLSLSGFASSEVGDGTFSAASTLIGSAGLVRTAVGDFNADGVTDIAAGDQSSPGVYIYLSTAIGSYSTTISYGWGSNASTLSTADVNRDGNLDLVTSATSDATISVALGNGNGTFKARTSYSVAGVDAFTTGDINGDSNIDIVAKTSSGRVMVLTGSASGTFTPANTYAVGGGPYTLQIADINEDGYQDLVAGDFSGLFVVLGNGNGSFKSPTAIPVGTGAIYSATSGDLNGDGNLDIIASAAGTEDTIRVYLGNGNGTFLAARTYRSGDGSEAVVLGDFNGDGVNDIYASGYDDNTGNIFIGNGDGSFKARISFSAGSNPSSTSVGDFDDDGVLDLAIGLFGDSTKIFIGNSTISQALPSFSLLTQAEARTSLDTISTSIDTVDRQLGNIGAQQSRLLAEANNLRQERELALTARSRITDADIASETANLVRLQILKQSAAAVAAQAGKEPEIALRLLGGI